MSKVSKSTEVQSSPLTLAPQGPASAFERFIELIRNGSAIYDIDPNTLLSLLRPFLVNPGRNEACVREISQAYAGALFSQSMRNVPLFKYGFRLMPKWMRTDTMEQVRPDFIKRLLSLEEALKTDLLPGSITLHVKPVRYIDTPTGFGIDKRHRYRIQVQTLIDALEDALQSVAVELTIGGGRRCSG